jgi:uncharacterized protein (DUF983 family)|tara:strand:+ start:220 stop:450 length:231 start_codon:yes stop_codon:yes gene_type:complete
MGIKKTIKFKTEVVNGVCPECNQDTLLVSVVPEMYKCTVCGENLRQHVNGKISYIPTMALSEKEKTELVLKDGQEI